MFCGVRAFGCDATSVRFVFKESPRCSRGSRIADKLLASLVWAAEGWAFRRDVSSSLRVSLVTGGVGDGDRRLRMERLAGKGRAQARSKRNSRHASERRSGSSEGRPTPQLHVAGRTSLCLWSLRAALTSGRKRSRFHVRFRIYEIGKKIKV